MFEFEIIADTVIRNYGRYLKLLQEFEIIADISI